MSGILNFFFFFMTKNFNSKNSSNWRLEILKLWPGGPKRKLLKELLWSTVGLLKRQQSSGINRLPGPAVVQGAVAPINPSELFSTKDSAYRFHTHINGGRCWRGSESWPRTVAFLSGCKFQNWRLGLLFVFVLFLLEKKNPPRSLFTQEHQQELSAAWL